MDQGVLANGMLLNFVCESSRMIFSFHLIRKTHFLRRGPKIAFYSLGNYLSLSLKSFSNSNLLALRTFPPIPLIILTSLMFEYHHSRQVYTLLYPKNGRPSLIVLQSNYFPWACPVSALTGQLIVCGMLWGDKLYEKCHYGLEFYWGIIFFSIYCSRRKAW